MSRTNEITKENIKNQISLYDVISKYTQLKPVGNKYIGLCPAHSERSPSFSLDLNKGIYKCFGCGFGGNNIFSFIMQKENLSFKDAIEFLKKDFVPNSVKRVIVKPPLETVINFVEQPYTGKHLEYWKNLEMDAAFLESNNVFAVKEWETGVKGNMYKIKKTKDEVTFAYYEPSIDRCKILRIGPQITKDIKWRTTIPNSFISKLDEVPENCENLFIAKSLKDALVLKKLDRTAVAVQSENAQIVLEYNYEILEQAAKNKVVVFGNDNQGWHQSLLLTYYTNWNYFNIENHLYDQYEIEDPADYINEGFSYQMLDKRLKQKNL